MSRKKLLRCKGCRQLTPGGGYCNTCSMKRAVAATEDATKHRAEIARLRDRLNKLTEE